MRQRTILGELRLRDRAPLLVSLLLTAAACTGGSDDPWWGPTTREPRTDEPSRRGPPPLFDEAPSPGEPLPPPFPLDPAPSFGATVTLDSAPPSLGAASLLVTTDGTTAIATDSDRDRVAIVRLATKEVKIVALAAGDEPGRLTLDEANRAHVVLDRAGEVATIDLASATVVTRRSVCAAPRGITRQGPDLFVACTGGEIVSLPANPDGAARVIARIDRDLRDIVAIGSDVLVSRLRTAEVLRVRRSDGVVLARAARPPEKNAEPAVAWRLASSGSGAVLVHQMARNDTIEVATPTAYGAPPTDPCGGPVVTTITSFTPTGEAGLSVQRHNSLSQAVVPVDIARSRDGDHFALVAAGNAYIKELAKVETVPTFGGAVCTAPPRAANGSVMPVEPGANPDGQAVALAFTPDDRLVVFSREPAAIHVRKGFNLWEKILLGGGSREDTGHAIFHSNSGKGIACVSCHPGGGDDGRVWNFSSGARRTQTLEGTLEGTAPYHWGGDMDGIESFGGPVFGGRMGGPHLGYAHLEALRSYLTRLPAPRISPASDAAAAARGKALFESASVGCSGCHSGDKLTSNESVDVGTGDVFQVPSLLGVGLRAPYLHDGRAKTLFDRFGPAGGGDNHGQTSTLTAAEVKDLVVYLETL